MKKKLAIIGKGTAGCYALSHFMRWTDWEIDLIHDPDIKPQAVGEGSDLVLPASLNEQFDFSYTDLCDIDGSLKLGIRKINWNGSNDFIHTFPAPNSSMHFNACKLQQYLIDRYADNDRMTIVEDKVDSDRIDADYIMDCSGKPENYDDYTVLSSIPVNSVYVTQCYWDRVDFQYTLTIARPYGWVFGIPLANRCSIGYMYNNTINTLEEVKEDVKEIFKQFNLNPSDTTSNFSFKNYYKKQNYDVRTCYNGNASFFLEPMEATSISTMDKIQRAAYDIWHDRIALETATDNYTKYLKEVEAMIMLHYYAGSKFDTKFWDFAKERANIVMEEAIKDQDFAKIIFNSKNPTEQTRQHRYASWHLISYTQNLTNLGLYNKFEFL
jgi:tryptophan halogenase